MSLRLSRTDQIDLGDSVVLWKGGDDDFRAISYNDLLKKLKEDITQSPTANQYVSLVNNATVDISTEKTNSWIKVIDSAADKTLTINMPLPSIVVDGQEVIFSNASSLDINIVFSTSGAIVLPTIPSIISNWSYTFKFDKVMNSWYLVGVGVDISQ